MPCLLQEQGAMAAAWRSALSKSLEANKAVPYRKFMQLGTVRTDGRPSVRTVVFRGFHNDTDQITFTTDTRHSARCAEHVLLLHACMHCAWQHNA
jgi:hypothetical protein